MRRLFVLAIAAMLLLAPYASVRAQSGEVGHQLCLSTARINGASSSTLLIGATGNASIRICNYAFSLASNATTSAQLVWGTGSTCGTGTTDASPVLSVGSTVTGGDGFIVSGDGSAFIDENPSRGVSNLCLVFTGSTPAANGYVRYYQGN